MEIRTVKIFLAMIVGSVLTLLIVLLWQNEPQVQMVYVNSKPSSVSYKSEMNPAQAKGWSSTAPLNFTTAANVATAAVVSIMAEERNSYRIFGSDEYETSMGSGVIISDKGHVVTNRHVIEDMDFIEVTLPNKSAYRATLLGIDASTDLAVLQIEGENFRHLKFANSDQTEIGEWVLAIGNPFSLSSTVTAGIVSAKGRNINIMEDPTSVESFIQTDAAVNAGNSGGALVNTRGELVGINTAILTKSGRYEGYSFAVPSNLVEKVSSDIIEFGAVQRAFLGINIEALSLRKATNLGMDHAFGVLITNIEPGSASDLAGLRTGDIITKVDGVVTNEVPILQERIALKRPGDQVQLELLRNGEQLLLKLPLMNINNKTSLISAPKNIAMAEMGFDVRELNDYEVRQVGEGGVIVSSIKPSSPAREMGMAEGFVLEYLNDVKLTNTNQFFKLLDRVEGDIYLEGRYLNKGDSYTYIVRR